MGGAAGVASAGAAGGGDGGGGAAAGLHICSSCCSKGLPLLSPLLSL